MQPKIYCRCKNIWAIISEIAKSKTREYVLYCVGFDETWVCRTNLDRRKFCFQYHPSWISLGSWPSWQLLAGRSLFMERVYWNPAMKIELCEINMLFSFSFQRTWTSSSQTWTKTSTAWFHSWNIKCTWTAIATAPRKCDDDIFHRHQVTLHCHDVIHSWPHARNATA